MPNPFLSIVIPAYNEASRIEPTLRAVLEYCKNANFSHKIIVVDDGSIDTTIATVEKFQDIHKNIKIIKNGKNRGKGYSVKRGMLAASGEYRLFMDADHSVNIGNLERFLAEAQSGSDIVVASIELPGSVVRDDNYGYRRIFGKMSKILIRRVATPGIYDTQRGFKLFNRRAAEAIFPRQRIDGWGFDIELLVIAQKDDLKIKEMAVEWANSKTSSVTIWSYFQTLYDLVRIKMHT